MLSSVFCWLQKKTGNKKSLFNRLQLFEAAFIYAYKVFLCSAALAALVALATRLRVVVVRVS